MTSSHSGLGHVDEHAVPEDAGVVDEHVDVAEGVDRRSGSAARRPAKSATLSVLATASPPRALISSTTSWAGPGVGARAVLRPAEVVDHDLGSLAGEQQGVVPADASPGARDHRDTTVQCAHQCLPLVCPTRGIGSDHSGLKLATRVPRSRLLRGIPGGSVTRVGHPVGHPVGDTPFPAGPW